MSKKIELTSRKDQFSAFIEQTKKFESELKNVKTFRELSENEKLSIVKLTTFRVFDDFKLIVKLRDVFNEMEDEGWQMFKDDGYINLTSSEMNFVKDFMMCVINQIEIKPKDDAKQ